MAYQPVLTSHINEPKSYTLDFYMKNLRGYEGLRKALTLKPNDIIEQVKASGLRGRGGAGFPTATKLRAVAVARGRALVVANGAEGEPRSGKDKVLLRYVPHLVLDGAELAAAAVGAREIVVAAAAGAARELRTLRAAVGERPRGRRSAEFRVVTVPDGFVSGEETALVNRLNGGPAKPTFTPPRPYERGVGGAPTLVQNVETLAHIALIARGEWEDTRLVTLSGAVRNPGAVEAAPEAKVADLVEPSEPLRALLVGGYFGGWVEPGEDVGPSGAGVVVALGRSACPVAETARLTAWLAHESAGQCGPCVHGLGALAGVLARLAAGRPERQDFARLARWTDMVRRRGACAHPDGAARMLASAQRVFAAELADHAHHGPCAACRAPRTLAA
jgi:NADH:ubiquinone oxidoreductase subunit F (NADH-binding)